MNTGHIPPPLPLLEFEYVPSIVHESKCIIGNKKRSIFHFRARDSLPKQQKMTDSIRCRAMALWFSRRLSFEMIMTSGLGGISTINVYDEDEDDVGIDVGSQMPNCNHSTLLKLKQETLTFSSHFQSGNLKLAKRIVNRIQPEESEVKLKEKPRRADQEYDLTCKIDTNTKGNIQWYYYAVYFPGQLKEFMSLYHDETPLEAMNKLPDVNYSSVMKRGFSVRFNLINMTKSDSLYNYGMKPCVYSMQKARNEGIGWHRSGRDICYYRNPRNRMTQDSTVIASESLNASAYCGTTASIMADIAQNNKLNMDEESEDEDEGEKKIKASSTLTFTYDFEYDDDIVFFAHCVPYTYHDLQLDLRDMSLLPHADSYLRRRELCKTIAGNTCELLTITHLASISESTEMRPSIVLSARVHPGESNSSYVMKGLLDFLTSDCQEAVELRSKFVFKIIPMLNPDGVIHGNYRTSLAGVDLNRRYIDPSPIYHPTIHAMKHLLKATHGSRGVLVYIDIHGHSKKKNAFFYGCDMGKIDVHLQKEFRIFSNEANMKQRIHGRILPKMISTLCKLSKLDSSQAFGNNFYKDREHSRIMTQLDSHRQECRTKYYSFQDCKFSVKEGKTQAGRVVAWRDLGIENSFTMEVSFCGSGDNKEQGQLKKYFKCIESQATATKAVSFLPELFTDNSKKEGSEEAEDSKKKILDNLSLSIERLKQNNLVYNRQYDVSDFENMGMILCKSFYHMFLMCSASGKSTKTQTIIDFHNWVGQSSPLLIEDNIQLITSLPRHLILKKGEKKTIKHSKENDDDIRQIESCRQKISSARTVDFESANECPISSSRSVKKAHKKRKRLAKRKSLSTAPDLELDMKSDSDTESTNDNQVSDELLRKLKADLDNLPVVSLLAFEWKGVSYLKLIASMRQNSSERALCKKIDLCDVSKWAHLWGKCCKSVSGVSTFDDNQVLTKKTIKRMLIMHNRILLKIPYPSSMPWIPYITQADSSISFRRPAVMDPYYLHCLTSKLNDPKVNSPTKHTKLSCVCDLRIFTEMQLWLHFYPAFYRNYNSSISSSIREWKKTYVSFDRTPVIKRPVALKKHKSPEIQERMDLVEDESVSLSPHQALSKSLSKSPSKLAQARIHESKSVESLKILPFVEKSNLEDQVPESRLTQSPIVFQSIEPINDGVSSQAAVAAESNDNYIHIEISDEEEEEYANPEYNVPIIESVVNETSEAYVAFDDDDMGMIDEEDSESGSDSNPSGDELDDDEQKNSEMWKLVSGAAEDSAKLNSSMRPEFHGCMRDRKHIRKERRNRDQSADTQKGEPVSNKSEKTKTRANYRNIESTRKNLFGYAEVSKRGQEEKHIRQDVYSSERTRSPNSLLRLAARRVQDDIKLSHLVESQDHYGSRQVLPKIEKQSTEDSLTDSNLVEPSETYLHHIPRQI